MSTFESQIAAAERRHNDRTANRDVNEALIRVGEPFKADTLERVHLWFRRRWLSSGMAERAIKVGDIPLEVQEAMRPHGRLEPVGLERVLSTSDLLGIAFLERGLQVVRTDGRASIRGRTGSPIGYGTGFMVGPPLLVTDNHVLTDAAQAGDSVILASALMTMSTKRLAISLATVLATAAGHASGAEIVLEQTAVQKLVEQNLFKDNGRYYVKRGTCAAYLETPTVSLRDGRVIIRAHLSGRFGAAVGGNCIGVGLASWAVVSGTPSSEGPVVRLTGIRLDDVQDSNTRLLLNSGLVPSLPSAIELDVMKAVKTMLQGAGGKIQADVQELDIQAVSATENKLSIRFDFKLVGM